MNFYNRRDFRVETTLNLLESWGLLEGHELTGEITDDLLEADLREIRFRHQNEKLLAMVRYATSSECRMKIIHDYFSEPLDVTCGVCDNCLKTGKKP